MNTAATANLKVTGRVMDFWDWLSPMIVKELRQGLRSRQFVIAFLALQGFFVFGIIMDLLIHDVSSSAPVTQTLFWAFAGLILGIVIPVGALNSVRGEMDGNTLDLVLLTREGAWRIICGKWLANVTLVCLLAVTALPYMTLRHFMGGVEIKMDFIMLAWLVLCSAVLSALATAASPFCSKLGRILLIGGAVFILPQAVMGVMALVGFGLLGMRGSSALPILSGWQIALLILDGLCALAILILVAFHLGAKRIAPASENHDIHVRLLLWGLLLCSLFTVWQREIYLAQLLVTSVLLFPFLASAPLQKIPPAAGAFRLLNRKGVGWKFGSLLFTPGWPSATIWSIATLLIMIGLLKIRPPASFDYRAMAILATLVAAVYAPSLLVRLLPLRKGQLPAALGLHALMAIISIPIGILAHNDKGDYTGITVLLPTTQLISLANEAIEDYNLTFHGVAAVILALASIIGLLILSVRGMQKWVRPIAAVPEPAPPAVTT